MDWDDLDDRVRRAAQAEPATVERVVTNALTPEAARRGLPRAGGPLGVLAVCLVALFALALWTARRPSAPTEQGVYRAVALPAPEVPRAEPAMPPQSPAPDGVYRAKASPAPGPGHVIRITADDGTTWILSTNASDDALPRGSAVIIGGEEER